jgi:SAM-dependent methyltransferase
MRMATDAISEYYRRGGERTRLTAGGAGRLEFLRTWDVLSRVLPPVPATLLDVGGATGVYARPLTAAGYRVHVLDLTPEPGVTAAVADARALPVADGAADAVLLLGPLYHLPERADRVAAWREAARAVAPGGVVVGAVISRFAFLLDGLLKGFFDDPGFPPLVERTLREGRHVNDSSGRSYFTTAYFHRPEEVAAEAEDAGLTDVQVIAVECPLWLNDDRLESLVDDPAATEAMLEVLRVVEREPSMLGASGHLLGVARRP